MTARHRDRRGAYLAWLSVCVVWGTTYPAIRVALETIPPALVGAFRYTFAGAALIITGVASAMFGRQLEGLVHEALARAPTGLTPRIES